MQSFIEHVPLVEETLIHETVVAGVTFVEVDCETIRERQAAIVRNHLGEIATRKHGRMGLDISKVMDVSSVFIHDLATLHAQCKKAGGRLVIFGLSETVLRGLRMSGLLKGFFIADSRKSAIELMHDPRARAAA